MRAVVIGLAVSGVFASSCASTARDTLIDVYNAETDNASYDDACLVDAKTIAVATEAYVANTGQPPASESDLVPSYLLESPDGWTFDGNGSTPFTPTPDGRCAGLDVDPSTSQSVGQNAVDRIDDARDTSCDANKRQIETALDAHFVINGEDATELSQLTEIDVEDLLDRYMLEAPTESSQAPLVVPVVDGPCDR